MEPKCFPKPNKVVSVPEPNHISVRQRSCSMATGRHNIAYYVVTKWFVCLSLTRPETLVTTSNWNWTSVSTYPPFAETYTSNINTGDWVVFSFIKTKNEWSQRKPEAGSNPRSRHNVVGMQRRRSRRGRRRLLAFSCGCWTLRNPSEGPRRVGRALIRISVDMAYRLPLYSKEKQHPQSEIIPHNKHKTIIGFSHFGSVVSLYLNCFHVTACKYVTLCLLSITSQLTGRKIIPPNTKRKKHNTKHIWWCHFIHM